ncbi:MAG TPA: exopolysaccharide biosynthesis protein [Alphaproteobacteria bacterium]|nr:exopolysaccharide biosynthesis protein [Alphaproteobacteria bacterium]
MALERDMGVDRSEHPAGPRTSELLLDLFRGHTAERITLGEMTAALHDRAFGLLMLILALPNSIPAPVAPGVSAVFGVPLAIIALQLALGQDHPRLSPLFERRSLKTVDVNRFLAQATPWLARLERLVKPRWPGVANPRTERVIGLIAFILAVALALPIPFGNLPLGFALVVISLGLLERDGAAIAFGTLIGVLGLIWAAVIVFAGTAFIETAWGWVFG